MIHVNPLLTNTQFAQFRWPGYSNSVPISPRFMQFWAGPCQEGSIIGNDILHQSEAKILLDVAEIDPLPLHIGKRNPNVASVGAPAPSPSHTLIVTHFPDPSALLTSLTSHIMFSALDISNGLIILCRLLLNPSPYSSNCR